MRTVRVLGCALLLTCTGLSTSAAAAEPRGGTSESTSVPFGSSTVSPLGFFWQLTAPQELVPGALLLAAPEVAPTKDKKVRSTRSDQEFFEISSTGSNDVPDAALRAYHRAADEMSSCGIKWTFLAAIGRVESDHGRYGGSQLGSDGVSRPEIRGLQLNGKGPVAAIRDSDGGKLDHDKVWDRAVGQMQFLPQTWASVARDGDGDGRANPDDIDDSALGSAVYLCGAGDLSEPAGMARAAFRYNHSDYYVNLVMSFYNGYETGHFAVPSPPPPPEKKRKKTAESTASTTKPKPRTSTTSTKPPAPKPTYTAPKPSPSSDPTSTPDPPPPPQPERVQLTGPVNPCGDNDFCTQGVTLDLTGWGGDVSPQDFDGDGVTESNREELAGLSAAGTTVTLVVDRLGDVGQVVRIESVG